jgi:FkbM family methyltransferase
LDPERAIFPCKDETRLVGEFFAGKPGYFVEVGANDPERWSQTFHLERVGWTGVLVEPQPHLAEELRQRRKARVFSVACSSPQNAGKTMTLHLAGGHTSLNPEHFVFGMRREGTIEVPLATLDQILTEAGAPAPLDFLSIDVEGHEIDVLAGFDIRRWRPRLILLEDEVQSLASQRYMLNKGYKWVRRTQLNGWYVPADLPMRVSAYGWLQFIRKYYLGVPFRRTRDAWRRLRIQAREWTARR